MNERSARWSAASFCTIMSMGMLAATLEKIASAAPGRCGTPRTVTRASFLASAAPQTATSGESSAGRYRARRVGEAAADMHEHAKLLGKLDRTVVHHVRPGTGQFQHLVVADPLDEPGLGNHARIGRVDAVDVGEDFTDVGPENGGQGDGRGVAAAAAKRGYVARLVNPLKTGGDDDVALVDPMDPLGRDGMDAGLGMGVVGADAHLGAGHADGLVPERMNGHRHQSDGDLFAGREEHVQFAGGGFGGNAAGKPEQAVGVLAHRRRGPSRPACLHSSRGSLFRRGKDLFAVGYTGSAEFWTEDGHEAGLVRVEVSGHWRFRANWPQTQYGIDWTISSGPSNLRRGGAWQLKGRLGLYTQKEV